MPGLNILFGAFISFSSMAVPQAKKAGMFCIVNHFEVITDLPFVPFVDNRFKKNFTCSCHSFICAECPIGIDEY